MTEVNPTVDCARKKKFFLRKLKPLWKFLKFPKRSINLTRHDITHWCISMLHRWQNVCLLAVINNKQKHFSIQSCKNQYLRLNENWSKISSFYLFSSFIFFYQDTFVNPHSFIVFKDEDTSTANSNIEFRLINDDAHIFKETCTKISSNHSTRESTVFYCSQFNLSRFTHKRN